MVLTLPEYKRIQFGYASAEQEGANDPDLLLRGFYDSERFTEEALNGGRFLVLGYKGSGKSALGERLRLLADADSSLFVHSLALGDFPYSYFTRIVKATGPTEAESEFPTVWTWVLLLMLLDSVERDNGTTQPDSLRAVIGALRKISALPAPDVKTLVVQSTKTTFRANLRSALQFSRETTEQPPDEDLLQYVETVKRAVAEFRSDSRHILILDGLDDIMSLKNVQYQVLAALVLAVDRMNTFFKQSGVPAKIVLLCRTDLFARLPGPNKNKLRQDCAIELDWYDDPRDPSKSRLIKLANHRAMASSPAIEDIFKSYFPGKMQGRDIRTYLAEHTRHTPRDFLRLLASIQAHAHPGRLAKEVILKGLRDYSLNYFLPEIRDELVGYVSVGQTTSLFSLLGSLRSRDFMLGQLRAFASRSQDATDLDLKRLMELLFECSAIGNVDPRSGFYYFKYRNRHSSINFGDRLVLHPGLWKAFNLADMALPELPDDL